jgi:hypothetical protein
MSDSIRVPERVVVHVLNIQQVLHESLCMRLQRRQTRFEELPALGVCSFSLEDALCGTHLLSQVLSVNPLPQQNQ